MAKHAIFSDIHANWEALVAVCRDLAKVDGLRSLISLGDLVGYGPNPNEVIAGLHSLARKGYEVRYCLGNHDGAAIGLFEFVDLHDPRDLERLASEAGLKSLEAIARQFRDPQRRKYVPVRYNAKASIRWTQERLTDASRQVLATQSKDYLLLADGVLCVHGSPRDPLFDYVMNARRAQRALETPLMADVRLCFIGHTHIPGIWQLPADDVVSYAGNIIVMHPPTAVKETSLELDPEETVTVVNVGSIGQPRDGDPRALYAIYDDDAQTVELRRVAYDVATTRQKILESGLPKVLAQRLGQADAERGVVAEPESEEDKKGPNK